MSEVWTTIAILSGGFATLAIYSFFYKENPLYRFFEHLYIGIAAGFTPVFTFRYFLWPKVVEPMLGMNVVTFPDGTAVAEYQAWSLWYLLPMAFGLLYYTIYFKRFSWMVKLVIGFSLGASATLAFKGFFAEMLPQIAGSFKPLLVLQDGSVDWWQSFCNSFFVVTLLLVMNYFFFTFRRESKVHAPASRGGRWLMMICFGSFFGSTVMAREALLVERLQFLYFDWYSQIVALLSSSSEVGP